MRLQGRYAMGEYLRRDWAGLGRDFTDTSLKNKLCSYLTMVEVWAWGLRESDLNGLGGPVLMSRGGTYD